MTPAEQCKADVEAWYGDHENCHDEIWDKQHAIDSLVTRLTPVYERAERAEAQERRTRGACWDLVHEAQMHRDNAEAEVIAAEVRADFAEADVERLREELERLRNDWKLALVNEELAQREVENLRWRIAGLEK